MIFIKICLFVISIVDISEYTYTSIKHVVVVVVIAKQQYLS